MSWIEIRSTYPEDLSDLSPIIDLYREFGIENTLEEANSLVGCLVDVEGSAERIKDLTAALNAAGASEVVSRPLPEDNWEEAWKAFFKPRRVGRHFVVRPTWEDAPAEPGDRVIVLDPGQAFGTGDHPTTRMCLELLENARLKGKRVLDLGCGSGILAVGAAMLGAEVVHATDVDAIAVQVAIENARVNNVTVETFVGEGLGALSGRRGKSTHEVQHDELPMHPETTPTGSLGIHAPRVTDFAPLKGFAAYDVVVSNIISATLIRLAPEIVHIVAPGGAWIVSGIISSNWPDVRRAACAQAFEYIEMREEDGWVAAAFVRL
jgi:ribosomal protein L11 methyltransferase